MHQFFVEDHQVGKDFITITGKDVHHIRNVLRMSQGEVVRISSTGGRNYRCRVLEVADEFVQMDILDSEVSGTELSGRILLFQGLPKGERMEYIIQKTVELGVTEIIPVAMRYCVVKLEGSRAGKKSAAGRPLRKMRQSSLNAALYRRFIRSCPFRRRLPVPAAATAVLCLMKMSRAWRPPERLFRPCGAQKASVCLSDRKEDSPRKK